MTSSIANTNVERWVAVAICLVLLISVVGFVYISYAYSSSRSFHGFQSAPIDVALLLFLMTETDVPRKIRESVIIKRQIWLWGIWLLILGVAPAFNPRAVSPTIVAVVAGAFMSVASLAGLFMKGHG